MNQRLTSLFFFILLAFTVFLIPTDISRADVNKAAVSTNILSVEKRINETDIFVGQKIVIEIILTNLGSGSIYDIEIKEKQLSNPFITYENYAPLYSFDEIKEKDTKVIAYTFSVSKVDIYIILETRVTYFKELPVKETDTPFLSVSQQITINATVLDETENTFEKFSLFVFSIGALTFSFILVIRLVFQIRKRNNEQS